MPMTQPNPASIQPHPETSTTPEEDEFSRLAAIVTSSDDAIIGLTLEDVEGKTVFFFFPKEMAERYHADDISIIRSGKPLLNREEVAVTRKGETILLSTTKVPFREQGGGIAGLVCLSRNITALQRVRRARSTRPSGKTK